MNKLIKYEVELPKLQQYICEEHSNLMTFIEGNIITAIPDEQTRDVSLQIADFLLEGCNDRPNHVFVRRDFEG